MNVPDMNVPDMNVPERHRAIAHAWIDGADIEFRIIGEKLWVLAGPYPAWYERLEFRIKPKTKVKKWRWVAEGTDGVLFISSHHHPDKCFSGLVQKIDSTMIEVDE